MNILLVEDEVGLREGLASFLRLRGHVVRAAGSCAEGAEIARSEDFDVVVTDWRLGDGVGQQVIEFCTCPVIVMSGYAEEVGATDGRAVVLGKPVTPQELLREVERQCPTPESAGPTLLEGLPQDTRDRFVAALWLAGDPPDAEVTDGGDTVTLRATLPADPDWAVERLERLGGDLRVLTEDGKHNLELRLYRDGRPDDVEVVRAGEPWPDGQGPFAIDLDESEVHGSAPWTPQQLLELVQDVDWAQRSGRTVHLLNIAPHARFFLELVGKDGLLPKRPKSGPRLPEVLRELWR